MATPVLQPTDIFDPNLFTTPSATSAFGLDGCSTTSQSPSKTIPTGGFTRFCHPQAGQVDLKSITLPHLQVLDVRWRPKTTFTLLDTTAFNAISTNFMVDGVMDSRMNGLPQPLLMRPQTHNFIHTPEAGHLNQLPGGQSLSMLIIDVDTDFFVQSIGQDDAWSERITTDLFHGRPLSGGRNAQAITPRMKWLVDDIRNGTATGPLRNLLIQSRVLELVALQIDQLKGEVSEGEVIPPDEAEKLHRLKAYLDAHFLEEHSLAQLSRYSVLNEFKVKRGFKKLFGTTVFNYLRSRRMDYAGQLLRSSTLTIEEIADQVGYTHGHHFAVAFKKYTGLNPSQYQRGKQPARPVKGQ